jgi:hypothetical protein
MFLKKDAMEGFKANGETCDALVILMTGYMLRETSG